MTHQKLVQAVRKLQQRVDELEAFAGVLVPVFEREYKRGTYLRSLRRDSRNDHAAQRELRHNRDGQD